MTELVLPLPAPSADAPPRWPATVVCGVNGTRQGREALRQAAVVLAPGGRLELHLVTRGHGFDHDADGILAGALAYAHDLGVDATARAAVDATAAAGLITAAQHADLLVVGCDALGPTPKAVLRHARCSVLLARHPADEPFGETVLVADADAPHLHELAAALADEQRAVPEPMLPVAAEATGCALIVTADRASAIQLARVAPCSVLVVRAPSVGG
jgi:nucleotide-binding universal stress UspA family protein